MIANGKFTREKLIRATRLSLAMLISVAYITYVGIAEGIAVTMTCAIILYDNPTVGGAINKSQLRFLGTLLGFMIAMIFIIGFANSMIANIIGIIIGIFLATYWFIDNKYSYVGIMTCATLPILLLNNGDIRIAFMRLLSISLGVLIAYLLNCFFYPDYARNRILITLKVLVTEFNVLLNALYDQNATQDDFTQIYLKNEPLIIQEFAKFVRWHSEAQHETLPAYTSAAFSLFANIRHIYHLLSIIAFNLDINPIREHQLTSRELATIISKIKLIIDSLEQNYTNSLMLQKFLNSNDKLARNQEQKIFAENELSATTIMATIATEIDSIIEQLIIIYDLRQTHNYY